MAQSTFLPVLLGARETAYGMACSFYEAYGVTSIALAQQVAPICEHSKVVRAASVPEFRKGSAFRDALRDFAQQPAHGHRTLILLPTENAYARLLANYADDLREYYCFIVADAPLAQQLARKSGFYALCQKHGLPYPAFTLVSSGQTPTGGAAARSAGPAGAVDSAGTSGTVEQAGRTAPRSAASAAGTATGPAEAAATGAGTDAGPEASASVRDNGRDRASDAYRHTSDERLRACEFLPLSALDDSSAYPLVMKPDDPEAFDGLAFRGKKNAYELRNRAEFDYGMSMLDAGGFVQPVVVQRQVAGPDDALHSLTCYCDQSGRVRLVAQADVVLEQEAPWSIGHFGAVVAGTDQPLAQQVARFLRAIGYRGFCNLDVKWDAGAQTWQFLDFNVALCDTSVLATAAGCNLARVLVGDVLDDAPAPSSQAGFLILEPDAAMLTKVPASTLRQYARNLQIWPRAQRLMQAHACTELFTPRYDQNFWRWKAYRSDQHFHRREFSDCRGRNHLND